MSKFLPWYKAIFGNTNIALVKQLKNDGEPPTPPYKGDYTMSQTDGVLFVNYPTEEYPSFNINNRGYLEVTYDSTKPVDLYIDNRGILIERSW